MYTFSKIQVSCGSIISKVVLVKCKIDGIRELVTW